MPIKRLEDLKEGDLVRLTKSKAADLSEPRYYYGDMPMTQERLAAFWSKPHPVHLDNSGYPAIMSPEEMGGGYFWFYLQDLVKMDAGGYCPECGQGLSDHSSCSLSNHSSCSQG